LLESSEQINSPSKRDLLRTEGSQNSLDYSLQSAKDDSGKKPDNRVLAVIAMNGFAMCSVGMSIFFKGIQKEGVSVIEFTLFRNLNNLAGACLLSCIYGINPCRDFPKEYRYTMFARASLGQACFACFTFCLALLPLSLQMILFQTSPFWAGILGFFINSEPIMRFEYIAMVICFCGVLAITFSKPEAPEGAVAVVEESSSTRYYGIALAFAIAWLFAACNVINRYLKRLHFAMVLFYHALCGICLASIFILGEHFITGNPFRIYTASQYKTIALCCFFDFCAVNCQTIAF
jgi:drug/metabolite transporter (DMT)-like permease